MEYLSKFSLNQAVINCIAEKSPICITRRNKTDWQIYKTQAISGSIRDGIKISKCQLVYGKEGNPSDKVGISFRQGNHKLLFNTILRNNILLCPSNIIKVSRHSYKRQSLKKSITVKFWSSDKINHGQLIDFSTGGMQVSAESNYDNGPYLCSIDHLKFSITADVILHRRKTLSFKFVGLEFSESLVSKLVRFTRELKRQHQN